MLNGGVYRVFYITKGRKELAFVLLLVALTSMVLLPSVGNSFSPFLDSLVSFQSQVLDFFAPISISVFYGGELVEQ